MTARQIQLIETHPKNRNPHTDILGNADLNQRSGVRRGDADEVRKATKGE